jgi:hypothetical protein
MSLNNIYDFSDLNSPKFLKDQNWRIYLGVAHGCAARMRKIIYVIPKL